MHDAELRGTVNYSVSQILEYSSNVGAVTLAEKLGAQGLANWVKKFGFGSTTGIDFPGESPGFVLPLDAVERPDDRQRADRRVAPLVERQDEPGALAGEVDAVSEPNPNLFTHDWSHCAPSFSAIVTAPTFDE